MKIEIVSFLIFNLPEYYLDQGVPQVGQDFVTAIIEHIESLFMHPDIGRVVPEFNEELIRELIHSPFRIVYLREPKSIYHSCMA